MSMGKRLRKGGWEQDAFSLYWRKYLLMRRAPVKRSVRRRERRQARQRDWLREPE